MATSGERRAGLSGRCGLRHSMIAMTYAAPGAAAAVEFASILRYLTGLARISLQYTAPDAG